MYMNSVSRTVIVREAKSRAPSGHFFWCQEFYVCVQWKQLAGILKTAGGNLLYNSLYFGDQFIFF